MKNQSIFYKGTLNTGLIIGVIAIIYFLLMYIAGIMPVGFFKPFLIMFIGLAINIAVITYMLKKFRRQNGDQISFGYAFLFAFLSMLVGSLISSLFTIIFIKFFDPNYMTNILEAQRTWMEGYLDGKVSEEQMQASLDKIDEAAKTPLLVSTLKSFLWSIGFGAVVALILGAILKKKPEVFEDPQ